MTKINNEREEIITDKTEINNHKITLQTVICQHIRQARRNG